MSKIQHRLGFLFIAMFFISQSWVLKAQEMQLSRTYYTPNEKISLRFTAPSGLANSAWIGIVPADIPHGKESVNDENDISYFHLEGRTAGILHFKAPEKSGSYTFRMHTTDSDGEEIASLNFAVKVMNQAYLETNMHHYAPKGKITVQFTADESFSSDAWIGIVPANVPHGDETENDKFDISYQYLKNRTSGILTFAAPEQLGEYTLRMHDTDAGGKEVASTPFSVTNDVAPENTSLSIEKTNFSPSETIVLHYTALSSFAKNAWVGIVPSNIDHGSEAVNDEHDISYKYLEQRTQGSFQFTAPTQSGQYDFRMHDTDDEGSEVHSISFTVE